MTMTAHEVAEVVARGAPIRCVNGQYSLRCPAHDDRKASLMVGEGDKGVVLKCHAGCTFQAVVAAANLDSRELSNHDPVDADETVYPYTNAIGEVLFEVVRKIPKGFYQRRPDGRGGYEFTLGGVERPLFRLPNVLAAIGQGRTIWIAEGEKDVLALCAKGAVATCNVGGAGKWRPEHSAVLHDARVIIVADKDQAGWSHARSVRDGLEGVAASVRIVEAKTGKDAADHLNGGHALKEFVRIWPPLTESIREADVHDFLEGDSSYDWLVEGLLERADRLVLTGYEGLGKSTLMVQIAVCLAAGVHPFRPTRKVKPLRVTLIDRENSPRQLRRKVGPIAAAVNGLPRDSFFCLTDPTTINLARPAAVEWLAERARAYRPDVLMIGPLYKLHEDNLNEEGASRQIACALDRVRAEVGCALIIEAHSGHGETERDRSVRPLGSSLWLRWPEFGYGLRPNQDTVGGTPVDFRAWRGPREERDWPKMLWRGKPLPWVDRAPVVEEF